MTAQNTIPAKSTALGLLKANNKTPTKKTYQTNVSEAPAKRMSETRSIQDEGNGANSPTIKARGKYSMEVSALFGI